MIKVFVIKKKYIIAFLAVILALLLSILLLFAFFRTDETFSETFRYAYYRITDEEAQNLISKNRDLTIVDLRDEYEYLNGHIPNAILMPYKVFKKTYRDFEKENKYLIYCENGKNSEKIAKTMAKEGYPMVYVLMGGIENWGYELKK